MYFCLKWLLSFLLWFVMCHPFLSEHLINPHKADEKA
jgi:hypothetical protein